MISSATIVAAVRLLEQNGITPDYPAHVLATAQVEGEWVKMLWALSRERFVREQQVPIAVAEYLLREQWEELVARTRHVAVLEQGTQRQ